MIKYMIILFCILLKVLTSYKIIYFIIYILVIEIDYTYIVIKIINLSKDPQC